MEIRNIQPPKAPSLSVEPGEETESIEAGGIHCSSHDYGPWRLNGTTLSIDIREIERSKRHPLAADDLNAEESAQSAETTNVPPIPAEQVAGCPRYSL